MPRISTILLAALACLPVAAGELTVEPRYYPSLQRLELAISENLFRTPDGQPGLRASYFDNTHTRGAPEITRVEPFPRLDKPFAHRHVGEDEYSIRWEGTYGPVTQTGYYVLSTVSDDGVRAWVGDQKIIDDWRGHPPAPNSGRVRLEQGQTVAFRLEYFEKGGGDTFQAEWGLGGADAGAETVTRKAQVELRDEAGETVLSREIAYAPGGGTVAVATGELPGGRYTVRVRPAAGGDWAQSTFLRERFAWEGNRLGITDEIYPPFAPMTRTDRTVGVVLRRYRVGGLGLWDSVQARGHESGYRELLAGPMQLVADGEPLRGEGEFTRTAPHEIVYEGQAEHPAIVAAVRATTEYDGCLRVELTMRPGTERRELRSLTLDIPLRDEHMPLWHLCTMGLRGNPAGHTPEGDGRVWQSQGQYNPVRPHGNRQRRGNWEPYVWLGAEERGLAWFADNDAGWVADYEADAPSLTLDRRDGVLTLRVHFVQKPVVLDRSRAIVFGLMASPAKPMPENWRSILLGNMWQYAGQVPGYRTFDWMGSQYWGSTERFSAKYPVNRDFTVLDKMQEAALTGRANLDPYLDIWASRHLGDDWPGGGHTREQTRRLVEVSVQWARRCPGDMTVYWEEFVKVSPTHRELETFGWEFTGGNGKTPTIGEAYRNFACWYGAEFLRRGIGLYFDNTFLEPAFDPNTTTAYRQADGHLQPSAGIWSRRAYLKRIWTLHRQLPPARTHPRMVLHMTNTQILPYMVWNDSNLDLEWRDHALPRQKAFSPELLRTESLGLQTGNIPQALSFQGAREDLSFFGSMMVHEIRGWFVDKQARALLQAMLEFGYGKPDCRVVNYWAEEPPFQVSDDACKWLLLVRGEQAMLLLCTWNAEAADVTATFAPEAGVRPREAVDVASDQTSAVDGGAFTFAMPGYGTRLFRLR